MEQEKELCDEVETVRVCVFAHVYVCMCAHGQACVCAHG